MWLPFGQNHMSLLLQLYSKSGIRPGESSSFIFSKIVLVIQVPLPLHVNSRISLLISTK